MQTAAAPSPKKKANAKAWLMLVMLLIAYIFSVVDRFILSLLVEPIERDLGIDDTTFGLLQGLAFVLFYSVLGVPIGRLVDHAKRVKVISAGILVWSIMTVMCGLAANFWQLLIARMGVGAGEASLAPAGYSLIADSFPQSQLGLANGIFYLGAFIGGGLAFAVGAQVVALTEGFGTLHLPLLGDIVPWQQTFIIIGLPGIIMAAAFSLLREPPRQTEQYKNLLPSWSSVKNFMLKSASWLLPMVLAIGCISIILAGCAAWMIAFLTRVHGMSTVNAGTYSGLSAIIGACIGLIGGGALSDVVCRYGSYWRLVLVACFLLVCAFACLILATTDSAMIAISCYGIILMMAGSSSAVTTTNLLENVPTRMRGLMSALFMISVNIIGAGVGPVSVALVSDKLLDGKTSIGTAMAIVSISASIGGIILLCLAAYNQYRLRLYPKAN